MAEENFGTGGAIGPPLSADFYRYQRLKSGNLQTTAAGSPNILWSHGSSLNRKITSSINIT
ncbi:hypothetical protein [Paenibacillus sp. FSL R5-0928]|uniref:hypothetical protein n=1 Tax=Paenibacillus sp. FSL R5-0928 TaxID=2921667 RepID=UPI0030DD7AFF